MRLRRALVSMVLVLACASAWAIEPIAVATMKDGSVAVLGRYQGIWKYGGKRPAQAVKDFSPFEPSELATDGSTYFVSLIAPLTGKDTVARVERWGDDGKLLGRWTLGKYGTTPTGMAFDAAALMVYCGSARGGEIYRLDLRFARPAFSLFFRVPNVGTIGPMVVDAPRKRLLVTDLLRGRILAVKLDGSSVSAVEVLLDTGTLASPSAIAITAAGRLYVTDSGKPSVWTGDVRGSRLTLQRFSPTQSFKEPVGIAVGRDGTIWIADRGMLKLRQFSSGGRAMREIDISR